MGRYDLDTIRHSSAHLMAQAISRLWPKANVEFGVGPVIENGFYYDLDMDTHLSSKDLDKIEQTMKEIIKEALPIERLVMSRKDAIDFFAAEGQSLKLELIEEIPEGEEISCYKQGTFVDLCRGPHVKNTRDLPTSFKLTSITGAYWRGSEKNKMLQRVYAVSFLNKQDLKTYLRTIELAKQRDHRTLGKQLELFHFEQCSPAGPFFMPKGAFIYNQLIEFMRRIYKKYGYQEVITPQILDVDLWKTSGHYKHYKENMYFCQIDDTEFAIKPMNCPTHMLMFKHYRFSYRQLPLRYADFGRLHRYEPHGALAGLTRVRTFCQDDAHIFLALEDIQEEIKSLMEMFFICYDHFGLTKIRVKLSTRPEKFSGDITSWDKAEDSLRKALEEGQYKYSINEGGGAFYGPKIDVEAADSLNRYLQLGTIQLDFQLPQSFDLTYIDANSEEKRPVVIHRALLGSIERFIGIYIEHTGGAFPFWLAPEQAIIVPIRPDLHTPFCRKLESYLKDFDMRVRVDDRNESMGYKTRQIQKAKIPFMLAVGDNEVKNNSVTIRAYGEKKTDNMTIDDLVCKFKKLQAQQIPAPLRHKSKGSWS